MTALHILPSHAVPIIALEPYNADAELVAFSHSLSDFYEQEERITASVPDEDYDRAIDELYQKRAALARQMIAVRAVTLEGLKAKAQAIRWIHSGSVDFQATSTDERLAESIIKDLLAI